jgi:hypothetical protein
MTFATDAQRQLALDMRRLWERRGFRVEWSVGVEMTSAMSIGSYVYLVATCVG